MSPHLARGINLLFDTGVPGDKFLDMSESTKLKRTKLLSNVAGVTAFNTMRKIVVDRMDKDRSTLVYTPLRTHVDAGDIEYYVCMLGAHGGRLKKRRAALDALAPHMSVFCARDVEIVTQAVQPYLGSARMWREKRVAYESAVQVFINEFCTSDMTVSDMTLGVEALLDCGATDETLLADVLFEAATERDDVLKEKARKANEEQASRMFASVARNVLCLTVAQGMPRNLQGRRLGVFNQYIELMDTCHLQLKDAANLSLCDAQEELETLALVKEASVMDMQEFALSNHSSAAIMTEKSFMKLAKLMSLKVGVHASTAFLRILQVVVERLVRSRVKSWSVLSNGKVTLAHVHRTSLCTSLRFDDEAVDRFLSDRSSVSKSAADQRAASAAEQRMNDMLKIMSSLFETAALADSKNQQQLAGSSSLLQLQAEIKSSIPSTAVAQMLDSINVDLSVKEYLKVFWIHVMHSNFTVAAITAKSEGRTIVPKDIIHSMMVESASAAGWAGNASGSGKSNRNSLEDAVVVPVMKKTLRGTKRAFGVAGGTGVSSSSASGVRVCVDSGSSGGGRGIYSQAHGDLPVCGNNVLDGREHGWEGWCVSDMKEILRKAKLPTSGTKAVLIKRLQDAGSL